MTDSRHAQPAIGVVIPVYGHSLLVAEAIESALSQDYDGTIDIIVVIDGDPNRETLATTRSLLAGAARTKPANRSLSAVYRKNGRLSAARNTGIRFLLGRSSDLFGIFLLDADNRLAARSMSAYVDALLSDPDAGWAYPDVTFFGLSWGQAGCDIRVTAPRYSKLRHLMGNICEAGSLVRTSVFRRGIFFDETFTQGYEDWEFWLQCLESGMHGTRVPDAGFLYRRRADSMLADADRISGDIVKRIHSKHAGLFSSEAIWDAYLGEMFPIVYLDESDEIIFLSGNGKMPRRIDEARAIATYFTANINHAYPPRLLAYRLGRRGAPTVDRAKMRAIVQQADGGEAHFMNQLGELAPEQSQEFDIALLPFERLLLDQPVPDELEGLASYRALEQALRDALTTPVLRHRARRYSGPATHLIDPFVVKGLHRTRPETDAAAKGADASLHGLLVCGDGADAEALKSLLQDHFQISTVDLDRLRRHKGGSMRHGMYAGIEYPYRYDDEFYDMIAELAAAFDVIFVGDDASYLFAAGIWKSRAPIIFITTRSISTSEVAQLQAVEHTLHRIVCKSEDRSNISSSGIPPFKIMTLRRVCDVDESGPGEESGPHGDKMIFFSRSALDEAYSARRLILCESSLLGLFTEAVATEATVLPLTGQTIGGGSDEQAIPLGQFGLPAGLEMIVSSPGAASALELLRECGETGFTAAVHHIEIAPGSDRLHLLEKYQAALEKIYSERGDHTARLEKDIVAVRRRLDFQIFAGQHIRRFLGMLGYSAQELFIEDIPDPAAAALVPPFSQPLPSVLTDVAGISIFAKPAETPSSVKLSIAVHGREVFSSSLALPPEGGWKGFFFPEEFLQYTQDATMAVEALEGSPTFAPARGSRAPDAVGSSMLPTRLAAIRLWRHPDPRVDPLTTMARVLLPKPARVKGNVLGQARLVRQAGVLNIDEVVSTAGPFFAQTHPVKREISNIVIRDFVIGQVAAVEALAHLAHRSSGPVRFMLALLPQVDDASAYETIRQAFAEGHDIPGGVSRDATLAGDGSELLTVPTDGLDPTKRYSLVMAAVAQQKDTKFGWARWEYVKCHLRTRPARQTYRYADFASLYSFVTFADGPFQEKEVNEKSGLPVLQITDGDEFLQTNTVSGRVVAARLESFVPAGMQRLLDRYLKCSRSRLSDGVRHSHRT